MEWKWPAEHNVDCNDYHPRFGNGRVVVGGHSSSSYKLQNACDGTTSSYYHSNTDDQPPSSPPSYGYGVNQDRYKGDYIDFIFTFEDANTWCSGYRQSYGQRPYVEDSEGNHYDVAVLHGFPSWREAVCYCKGASHPEAEPQTD